jgi:hypothetical protein
VTNALALLLGKAAAVKAPAKRSGPHEDLVKAIADFRSAPNDVEAADALLLAVQLAGEQGNSDLADEDT